MTLNEARRLDAGARAAGLSRGAYLAGLVADVPVLSADAGRAQHIATLMASSAELSTLSRNIHRLTALLRQANVEPARPYREMLDTLASEVRRHLERASRVMADLQPRGRSDSSPAHPTRRLKQIAMAYLPNIDGILITWGDRLCFPGIRVVKVKPQPRLSGEAARVRAAAIRKRIEATVVRRAPQVMVKVTGGGRGTKATAAHFRYISKNGQQEIEDQRGQTMRGKAGAPTAARVGGHATLRSGRSIRRDVDRDEGRRCLRQRAVGPATETRSIRAIRMPSANCWMCCRDQGQLQTVCSRSDLASDVGGRRIRPLRSRSGGGPLYLGTPGSRQADLT